MDGVWKNVRNLDMGDWKTKVQEREKVQQDKTHKGM
jgi:hypothetical protein